MEWDKDFSYRYYKKILQVVKREFNLVSFPDALKPWTKPSLILRHDVDISLRRALVMAEIEKELNVNATYLVMLKSSLYELDQNYLFRIMELGHEIGLHVSLEEKIPEAKRKLEKTIGTPIRVFSFHHPTEQYLRGPLIIDGMVNAYSKKLMDCYISDSRGLFRVGEPIRFLKGTKKPLVQLLIHPAWWGWKRPVGL